MDILFKPCGILMDILFKPLGTIKSKDLKIIHPNGEEQNSNSSSYVFIGDKVKNISNTEIVLHINGKEIVLKPGEVSTIIPISERAIKNIAILQEELIKDKDVKELEKTKEGKELIEEFGSLSGGGKFEHSGHYSNISSQAGNVDFIENNILKAEADKHKEPNIWEDYRTYIPTPAYVFKTPEKGPGSAASELDDDVVPTTPLPPITAIDINDIIFTEDANSNGHLTPAENTTDPLLTTVRLNLPNDIEINDTIKITPNGKPTIEIVIQNVDKARGYIEQSIPIKDRSTLTITTQVEHNGRTSSPTSKSLIIDPDIPPKIENTDITFTEDTNSNGRLTPDENATTPNTTTVRVALPNGAKINDVLKIKSSGLTTAHEDNTTITQTDKNNGYVEFEVPTKKGATIKVEAHLERGTNKSDIAEKTLVIEQDVAPKLTANSITFTEDTNTNGHLAPLENTTAPATTTVRITLPNDIKNNDVINIKSVGTTHTDTHTVTNATKLRGYVDFEVPVTEGTTLKIESNVTRGEVSSTPITKDLIIDENVVPKLTTNNIIFTEDADSSGNLTILENTTNPTTTTVKITLPNDVVANDSVNIKSVGTTHTASHAVTTTDKTNGYVTFEVPIEEGTTLKIEGNISRLGKNGDKVEKSLDIDQNPANRISLSIEAINGNGHITDADLSDRTIKAIIHVNNKELLNDGYEVEVKVYDKTIKAYKQDDGTFAADIRLADYKDDADQKISVSLKNATLDITPAGGTPTTINVPEKTAEASYDTNFTRSVLDILNVNDLNVMSLADIKNNADVHINGEVRGIYHKTGDKVFLTLPHGTVVSADVQADGSFSATVKPSQLGYPTTTDPDTYTYPEITTLINGKYTNDTGIYTDSHNFKVDLRSGFIGLTPTFTLADDNDAAINFVDVADGRSSFKYSINLDDTDKIYATPNGGKFKINLNFDNSGWRDSHYDPLVINEESAKYLSKMTAGWRYEVYLTKEPMRAYDYKSGFYEALSWSATHTKIYEGTIVDGKIQYTHDFNIKDYEPTKPADNMIYNIGVKLIPPAGDHTYFNLKQDGANNVFNSDALQADNHRVDTATQGNYVFSNNLNTFSNVPAAALGEKIGSFALNSDADANTLYYTPSVDKIDMTSFLFGAKDNIAANTPGFNSTLVAWVNDYPKPDEIYLTINGKKYEGIIDPKVAKVRFKYIDTSDFKNDPDHKYEITMVNRDKYQNNIRTTKEISYSVVDEPAVSASEIDKAFTLSVNGIGVETSYKGLLGVAAKGPLISEPARDQVYIGDKTTLPTYMAFDSNLKGELVATLRNKYVSHLDHDITLKLDIQTNGNNIEKLWWYDPSDDKIKEVHNNEITIKAGTAFKDIRIVQALTDNDTLNYDSIDNSTNEYGGSVTNSNMSLKKQNVVIKLKNSNDEVLSTTNTFVGDNDYDVLITPNSNSVDMTDYLGYSSMDGNRKITFNNTATSTYSIKHADRLLNVPIEFANENVNITFSDSSIHYNGGASFKKLIFSKGNNVLDLSGMYRFANIEEIISNMSSAELASNPTYTLEIRRPNNFETNFFIKGESEHDFQGLNILKSTGNKPLTFSFRRFMEDSFHADTKIVKNLTTNENVNFVFSNSIDAVIDNFNISNNAVTDKPILTFKAENKNLAYEQTTTIKNSTINANIVDAPSLVLDNTKVGIAGDSTPTTITLSGDLELKSSSVFLNDVEITALGGSSSYNNYYIIDNTIDKGFTLTDTTVIDGGLNKFSFGSHANIGNRAKFNVDNSEMIFENGSEFHGKIVAGHGNTSITIKSGATFDGTIDMSDAINNITIEDGAILGPNFHILETSPGNEADSGKYDTLNIFEDFDFNTHDVKGIDQINIGTKARGEMINLDLVYGELRNLIDGNDNVLKFWGDNDNGITLHNETGKTFMQSADQSGVNGQPYTRYEVTDTATGKTLMFDIHNDINLTIM